MTHPDDRSGQTPRSVEQRITDYLTSGGLFNPELANHDAVRDLLIDARAKIAEQAPLIEKATRDLQAGALEVREARNEILRADTDARRSAAYAELLTEAAHAIAERIRACRNYELNIHSAGMKFDLDAIEAALAKNPDQAGSAKAAGAPGAESTAAPTNDVHGVGVTCVYCGVPFERRGATWKHPDDGCILSAAHVRAAPAPPEAVAPGNHCHDGAACCWPWECSREGKCQRADAPPEAVAAEPRSGLDSERRWQAMANLTCEAEKFYLQHGGRVEWDALMDETNRILDLDDATLLDNLSERPRVCRNCGATERPDACSGGPSCSYPPQMRNDPNSMSDDARDALRYRRFRALAEYGHFIIQHYPGDGEDCVLMDGYRHEVDAAIDDPAVARKADAYIKVLANQRNQVGATRGDTPEDSAK